jgi:hypothetical protein
MGQGDYDDVRVWSCNCGLSFDTYEKRHEHICPPTKEELLLLAADKVVKETEDLLAEYQEYSHESLNVEPTYEAIEEYKQLRNK